MMSKINKVVSKIKKILSNSIELMDRVQDRQPELPKTGLSVEFGFAGYALHWCLENKNFDTVLDIGSGNGKHAEAFERRGKIVTRLDYGKSRRFTDKSPVLIGDFIQHNFDQKFDLVWASHVLEHSLHPHKFLTKILDITHPNGTVAITVPPAKSEFVTGHTTLWTPALLLYHLVLAGFDCANAIVLVYGYNISVIVEAKRNSLSLSDLAWDLNDFYTIKDWLPPDLEIRADGARFGTIFRNADVFFRT